MHDVLVTVFGASTLELLSFSGEGRAASLLYGFKNSVIVAFGAFGLGLLIGICGAYGKLYGGPIVRDLLAIYTTLVRALPDLVLVLVIFYAGTDLINQLLAVVGWGPIDIGGIPAGIGVLGVVQGAYSTEVLRGAILGIPQGQIEAARAYGMPPALLLGRITVPAMLPFAIPGLANLWLIATKDTALLALIGVNELTQMARNAGGSTKAYLTFFTAAGALYLALTLVSNVIIARIERRVRRGMPSMAGAH